MAVKKRRLGAILGGGVGLLALWACVPIELTQPESEDRSKVCCAPTPELLIHEGREVDILFVIDDSCSMLNEQIKLRAQYVVLMNELRSLPGGMPDLHVGVVTTDLGTADYTTIRYCEEVGGDRGVLGKVKGINLGERCIGPGQRYIVDIEPDGCEVKRDTDGICITDTCFQHHCDRSAGGDEVLTLVTDDYGCPRCRNYEGSLGDTFSCMASIGANGCGFEQQLEAMRLALDRTSTPENDGFLRDDAYLSVIIITDEDDCSAARPDVIYDPSPSENRMDSELGYLSCFRCFEFGIKCDEGGREAGPRNNCEPWPEDDPDAMLHPVSRYTAFLEALKGPYFMTVAVIGGPFDGTVEVRPDSQGRQQVRPTCTDLSGHGATPGIRLKAFTAHFNSPADLNRWAYTSVCSEDYTPVLEGIGRKIATAVSEKCPWHPLAGCPRGPDGTDCAPCLPRCEVFDIVDRGRENQHRLRVPWCGEVCGAGLCTEEKVRECGYDPNGRCVCPNRFYPTNMFGREGCAPLRYPDAMPESDRDPSLAQLVPRLEPACMGLDCPEGTEGRASACWYLTRDTGCLYGAGLRIARPSDPPPGVFTDFRCAFVPETEFLCRDGEDNDQDCLTDLDDLDCTT